MGWKLAMIDPLALATTFANLVQLLGQFTQSRNTSSEHTLGEFRDWLTESNHGELVKLLNENTKTTISIKALLNCSKQELDMKIQSLTNGLIDLMSGVEELSADLNAMKYPNLAQGQGGAGGGGKIFGDSGVIIGGRGGKGGVYGSGGSGGSGEIHGDNGMIIGGDGGDAGTADGRGGRGARGPTERLGFPTEFWGYGRGGSGANAPEYDRRLTLLMEIREDYLIKFPDERRFVMAGVDQIPIDWVNQKLIERGEKWQVISLAEGGYVMPPLN